MTDVVFPSLSANEGTVGVLSTWFVRDGESVQADELLAEVQVDKVSAEVVAPCGGTVSLLVKEEEEVVQGAPIARIE